jgi:hypothetical protein
MNNKSKKLIALVLLGVFAYISLNYLISKKDSKQNQLKQKESISILSNDNKTIKNLLIPITNDNTIVNKLQSGGNWHTR